MRVPHPSTTAGYHRSGRLGAAGILFLVTMPAAQLGAFASNRLPASLPQPVRAPVSVGPDLSPELAAPVAERLVDAFGLALAHLEEHPSCRRLFDSLQIDAEASLLRGVYAPAPARQELGACRSGASAFTRVGDRVTFVCRSFGRLSTEQAAIRLVHEALHQAGLPEAPREPTAMASIEINRLVERSCRL